MPRTNLCGGESKMRLTIGQYIACAMEGVCNQTELAKALGITQPALSYKIKKSQFRLDEMQVISKVLKLSDEEIINIVRRGRK